MIKRLFLLLSLSVFLTTVGFAQGPDPAEGTTKTTARSDTKKRPPVFRPTKDQIIQVQIKLKDKKLYSGEASGKYNEETRTGIKSFQKDNGLKQTGTLNRATLEKFEVELTDSQKLIPVSQNSYAAASDPDTSSATTASKTTKPKPVIFRATVDQIKAAQRTLKGKGLYAGEETGKLDDDTRAALKKFQDESGIKVTGTLNALTLDKMGIPLTDKQKADAASTAKTDN